MSDNSLKVKVKTGLKWVASSPVIQTVVAYIVKAYILLVTATSRFYITGEVEDLKKAIQENKSVILFTWHGRLLMAPILFRRAIKPLDYRNLNLTVLSSEHRDGQVAGKTMSLFGFREIQGSTMDATKGSSSNKKSLTALRTIMREIDRGTVFVFAADGPRGPAGQVNSHMAVVAQRTNTPIISAAISHWPRIQLSTWDKFQIPLPFSKIQVEFAPPYFVAEDISNEEANELLANQLNSILAKNDKNLRHLR